MITTILFFLLKFYKRRQPEKAARIQTIFARISRATGLVILCLVISMFSSSQDKKLAYNIYRNGNAIGSINFSQQSAGHRTILKLESEIQTRLIFMMTVNAKDESVYDSGIMTWSSVYRNMNGSEKENKKIKAAGNNYTIFKGSKTATLNKYPIRYNMLSLYASEPIAVSQVYSDIFEQFLDIKKIGDHKYKIDMPDGNYNKYHYENGILNKVDVSTTFYSASIQLKK